MELHVSITSDHPLYFVGWATLAILIFGPILLANNAGIRVRHTFEKSWAYLLLISYFAMTGVSMVRATSWGTSLLLRVASPGC